MTKKNYNIVLIPGDGIGPEVLDAARVVLGAVAARFGFEFNTKTALAGGAAIDACGEPLPFETLALCKAADAVLLGAIGGEKWDNLIGSVRPEQAILGLRRELGLFANIRPCVLFPELADASPLKKELTCGGVDILIVRELTGGIYFGNSGKTGAGESEAAWDTERYTTAEVRRIAKVAFERAMARKRRIVSVDKANVLESSRLWRRVVIETARDYPEIILSHMYVDNAAMQLIKNPAQFDVIVTTNMFGDILSDEAAQIVGSIGMLPSASVGADGCPALFEPIHGSAPDIAGKNIANPIAAILSVSMMLDNLGLKTAADSVTKAVKAALAAGERTADIAQPGDSTKIIGTREMAQHVVSYIYTPRRKHLLRNYNEFSAGSIRPSCEK